MPPLQDILEATCAPYRTWMPHLDLDHWSYLQRTLISVATFHAVCYVELNYKSMALCHTPGTITFFHITHTFLLSKINLGVRTLTCIVGSFPSFEEQFPLHQSSTSASNHHHYDGGDHAISTLCSRTEHFG